MNHVSQFALLKDRRFWPLFWTQFLGACNDNIYKNALVIMLAFQAMGTGTLSAGTLINLCAGVFILPFFLFSATAGQLAEKYDKSRLIRYVKLFEIGIMACAALGFHQNNLMLLLAALFCMGLHSTLFGPVKYSILPQHLRPEELLGGNGMVEMGTFIAILAGTILGGILITQGTQGHTLVSVAVLAVAGLGWLVSRAVPEAPAPIPTLRLNWNPLSETWRNLRHSGQDRIVLVCVLGISWFWFYGATFLSQFPSYGKDVLGGNEHVVTLLLTLFSIGVGTGSLLCERLSGGTIQPGLVSLGSIGLTVTAVALYFATPALPPTHLLGAGEFLRDPAHWRLLADLTLIGVFGGLYIVPLYTLIQTRGGPGGCSRIIAANNILNALFMVASAGMAIGLLHIGLSIPQLLLVTGLLNGTVALYLYRFMPGSLLDFIRGLLPPARADQEEAKGPSALGPPGPALDTSASGEIPDDAQSTESTNPWGKVLSPCTGTNGEAAP